MKAEIIDDKDRTYFLELSKKLGGETWDVQHFIKSWAALVDGKAVASLSFGKYGNQYNLSSPMVLDKYLKTKIPQMLIEEIKKEARKRGLKVLYQTGQRPQLSKAFGLVEATPEEVPKEFLMCYRCKKFRKTCFPQNHKLIID